VHVREGRPPPVLVAVFPPVNIAKRHYPNDLKESGYLDRRNLLAHEPSRARRPKLPRPVFRAVTRGVPLRQRVALRPIVTRAPSRAPERRATQRAFS
jgi:hypothetical protein